MKDTLVGRLSQGVKNLLSFLNLAFTIVTKLMPARKNSEFYASATQICHQILVLGKGMEAAVFVTNNVKQNMTQRRPIKLIVLIRNSLWGCTYTLYSRYGCTIFLEY